jgi:tetratricopeptide (TPR) repeat protein
MLALACSGTSVNPEMKETREGLEHWREGVTALEEGNHVAAQTAFERALSTRPKDPVLKLWRAKALAAGEQVPQAIDLLDEVLRDAPTLLEARYNKAAYLARTGSLELAGPELSHVCSLDARFVSIAMTDSDFSKALHHPAFSFLPSRELSIQLEPVHESVFIGDEFELTMRVVGLASSAFEGKVLNASGPARLLELVETKTPVGAENVAATFRFRLLAEGPGTVTIGPFSLTSEGSTAQTPAVEIRVLAPPDSPVSSSNLEAARLQSPVAVRASRPAMKPWVTHKRVYIVLKPEERATLNGKLSDSRYRFFEKELERWVIHAWELDTGPQRMVVRRDGATLSEFPIVNPERLMEE